MSRASAVAPAFFPVHLLLKLAAAAAAAAAGGISTTGLWDSSLAYIWCCASWKLNPVVEVVHASLDA